jgi:hypothetical protein
MFHTKKINIMQQTIEEIKQQYPDEWLILGDPVMSEDEQRILAADLLYHSYDKRALVYMDKPLMKSCKRHAILFNRVTLRKRSFLVGGRTIHSATVSYDNAPTGPIKSIYE